MTKTPLEFWLRVKELFEQALDRSGDERAQFLKASCAGDAELLFEVESLLAEHDQRQLHLISPTPSPTRASPRLTAPWL